MLLMIDNYDSFTYNIVQYFGELGQAARVYRNDAITLEEIEALKPDYLVIGPGPVLRRRRAYRLPPSRPSRAGYRFWAFASDIRPLARPSAAGWRMPGN